MVTETRNRNHTLISLLIIGIGFVSAASLQFFSFETFRLYDASQWGNQALYVQTGNPEQFNWEAAYGHPGGTLIIGTSIVQFVTRSSYEDALILFLSLADAVLITAICIVTFLLRKNFMWSLVAFLFLTLNPLYLLSTPPSVLASLLTVLLASITLFLYERQTPCTVTHALIWGSVAGLVSVTRIDVGILTGGLFGILAYRCLGIRKSIIAGTAAVIMFTAMDPFMWFMPLQHLYDLVTKIYQHVAIISLEHPSLLEVVDATSIACLGVVLALVSLASRTEASRRVPRAFLSVLIFMTGIVLGIYGMAHNQALRYLQPVVFLWQWLLPLLLLNSIDALPYLPRTKRAIQAIALFLLMVYPILIFAIHAL